MNEQECQLCNWWKSKDGHWGLCLNPDITGAIQFFDSTVKSTPGSEGTQWSLGCSRREFSFYKTYGCIHWEKNNCIDMLCPHCGEPIKKEPK